MESQAAILRGENMNRRTMLTGIAASSITPPVLAKALYTEDSDPQVLVQVTFYRDKEFSSKSLFNDLPPPHFDTANIVKWVRIAEWKDLDVTQKRDILNNKLRRSCYHSEDNDKYWSGYYWDVVRESEIPPVKFMRDQLRCAFAYDREERMITEAHDLGIPLHLLK